jgi:hypothetical protein
MWITQAFEARNTNAADHSQKSMNSNHNIRGSAGLQVVGRVLESAFVVGKAVINVSG